MDSRHAELLGSIDTVTLGHRLRAARQAQGLTQADLADGGISVGYVSRIESGQRRPQGHVLESMAARLGISLEILLSGVEQRELDEIRLQLDYAELSLESGQGEDALRQAAAARTRAEQAGQTDLAERGQYLTARAHEACGSLDDAILELESIIATTESRMTQIKAGIALSRNYRDSGDLVLAIDSAERILQEVTDAGLGSCDEAVQLTVTMAAAYFERGDVRQAIRVCRRAMALAEDVGSAKARASAYWNASMMEMQRGSLSDAVVLAERALTLFAEGSDSRNLARLRSEVGNMYLHQDPPQLEDAQRELTLAAEEMVWSSAGPVDTSRNDVFRARALLLGGEYGAAIDLCNQIVLAMRETHPFVAAQAFAIIAQCYAARGETNEAQASLQHSVLLLTGIGSDQRAAEQWYELGGLLDDFGNMEAALDAYRRAGAAAGLRKGAAIERSRIAHG